jgi:hypothetical protein
MGEIEYDHGNGNSVGGALVRKAICGFGLIPSFLAGFLLVGAHAASAQSAPLSGPGPLALTIRAVQDVVEVGSPVVLEVTAKNISDRMAGLATWGPIEYTEFDVHDSAGNQPLTRRGRALLFGEGQSG